MTDFDGEAFIDRFNTVWDAHDLDGIADMFTDDVIFEASFGPHAYGERASGKDAAKKLAAAVFETVPDLHFAEIRHVVMPGLAVVESKTTGTPWLLAIPIAASISGLQSARERNIMRAVFNASVYRSSSLKWSTRGSSPRRRIASA